MSEATAEDFLPWRIADDDDAPAVLLISSDFCGTGEGVGEGVEIQEKDEEEEGVADLSLSVLEATAGNPLSENDDTLGVRSEELGRRLETEFVVLVVDDVALLDDKMEISEVEVEAEGVLEPESPTPPSAPPPPLPPPTPNESESPNPSLQSNSDPNAGKSNDRTGGAEGKTGPDLDDEVDEDDAAEWDDWSDSWLSRLCAVIEP